MKIQSVVVASLLGVAAATTCMAPEDRPPCSLTAMTYNLYIGYDGGPLFTAQSDEELTEAVLTANAQAVGSNPELRMEAVVDAMAMHLPDVVGFQVDSTWCKFLKQVHLA